MIAGDRQAMSGWGWDDVLPYFKNQKITAKAPMTCMVLAANGGLKISAYHGRFWMRFADACVQYGLPHTRL